MHCRGFIILSLLLSFPSLTQADSLWVDANAPFSYDDGLSFENVVSLVFPTAGREKRAPFLPLPYWGKKKPSYRDFEWQRFDSQHFVFYSYPAGEEKMRELIQIFESEFPRNNDLFGVDARFSLKVPVIFYQTRGDFEQTHTIRGLIPEGLGGVTETISWKRVIFPFEGEQSKFEHVAKHEGTHIYQIALKPNLPLWFIEGTAESNSVIWDADAETVLRDAYLNGLIPTFEQMSAIDGTWLMYKLGNFITNVIIKEFGRDGLTRIYRNSNRLGFTKNIKESLGIEISELEKRVRDHLNQKYGPLLKQEDLIDDAIKLADGVLLAAHENFYLSGEPRGGRQTITLRHLNQRKKDSPAIVVNDRRLGVESLRRYQGGADINATHILYTVKVNRRDALQRRTYEFESKTHQFKLGEPEIYSWEAIDSITDPVLLENDRVAFIGYEQGYSNLYLFEIRSKQLTKLTNDRFALRGLTAIPGQNTLIFSREMSGKLGKAVAPCDYNYDLFRFDLSTLKEVQMTQTPYDERRARVSPDGRQLLYVSDQDGFYHLHRLDLATGQSELLATPRIGHLAVEWNGLDNIYFLSPRKLTPEIYARPLPSRREAFPRTIHPLTVTSTLEIPYGPMLIKNSQLTFELGDSYPIDGVAMIRGAPFMVSAASPRKKSQDKRVQYFLLGKTAAEVLGTTNLGGEYQVQQVKTRLKELLERNTLMNLFVSTSGLQAVVRINKILSIDNRRRQSDIELLYIEFDPVDPNLPPKITPIPADRYLSEFRFQIDRVYFLADRQVAFVTSNSRNPKNKVRISIFDALTGLIERPFGRPLEIALDNNGEKLAVRSSPTEIEIYDAKLHKKTLAYKDKYLVSSPSFVFNERGELGILEKLPAVKGQSNNENSYRLRFGSGRVPAYEFRLESRYQLIGAVFSDTQTDQRFLFALRCRDLKSDRRNETLFLINSQTGVRQQLFANAQSFANMLFTGSVLLFETIDRFGKRQFKWATEEQSGEFAQIEHATYHTPTDHLIFEGDQGIYELDLKQRQLNQIAKTSRGFTWSDNPDQLIFSALQNDAPPSAAYFKLRTRQYNLKAKTNSPLPIAIDGDSFDPVWQDGHLEFKNYQNGILKRGVFDPKGSPTLIWPPASAKPVVPHLSQEVTDFAINPQTQSNRAYQRYRLRNIAAAAAFDGSQVRYFISAYADNLFSDKALFANSLLFSDEMVTTLGITDLIHGLSFQANYSDLRESKMASLLANKKWLFDEFREFNFFAELEIQDYAPFDPTIAADKPWITPQIASETFYLGKTGLAYGFDETLWDRHGPYAGKRFFFRGELGFDLTDGSLMNADAIVDARLYHNLLPRLGLAHRLVGGISRGDLPTVFLLGGNISFRGVGFDDLAGDTYWVLSEDLRIPLFDVIGAKLPDPLDNFLGALTRYFDVRGGIYGDVGAVWFEDSPYETLYSIGYFFNVPTPFGLNLRFSHGLFGETDFGVWVGFNW